MIDLIGEYWYYGAAAACLFVAVKCFKMLAIRVFWLEGIRKMKDYGGGDLRRDRTPGFFGRRGR